MSDNKRDELDYVLNWIRVRFSEDYTIEQVSLPEYDGDTYKVVLKSRSEGGRILTIPVEPKTE